MTLAISVLLPTYNRARFIAAAIQSALDQTYPPAEIVVLDDGSTDNTAEVVRGFADTRLRYIHQQNRGISGALNAAFRAARGECVAILNSDDLWLPELLASEAPVLERAPEIGVVYARAQAMDSEGRPLAPMLGVPEKYTGQTFRSLLYGDHVCGITALIRQQCVERAGLWDEDIVANEDWDMWLRLALVCRFHFVDRVLARFRFHTENISAGGSKHFAQLSLDRIRVLDKIFARNDLTPAALAMRGVAYQNVYTDVALRWLSVGDWPQALRYLVRALGSAPNPFAAPFRILYLIVFYQYLSKHAWSVRLVNVLVDFRRRHGR